MSELHSLKHRFDISICTLDYFIPLVNRMFLNCIENIEKELFKESVLDFNTSFCFYVMSGQKIESIISDALLFLNDDERNRFYKVCKVEFKKRKETLTFCVSQKIQNWTDNEAALLEDIFFENSDIGIEGFPLKRTEPNYNFPNDLCNGIVEFYNRFESEIDRLLPFISKQEKDYKNEVPRLQTNLTTNQRAQLFEGLKNGGFIPNDTAPECFNWAIAATDEEKPTPPMQWQPIEWNKNKQLLRELLEAIKSDNIKIVDIEKITPVLFCKNREPYELTNNKVVETKDHKILKKIIATCINN